MEKRYVLVIDLKEGFIETSFDSLTEVKKCILSNLTVEDEGYWVYDTLEKKVVILDLVKAAIEDDVSFKKLVEEGYMVFVEEDYVQIVHINKNDEEEYIYIDLKTLDVTFYDKVDLKTIRLTYHLVLSLSRPNMDYYFLRGIKK